MNDKEKEQALSRAYWEGRQGGRRGVSAFPWACPAWRSGMRTGERENWCIREAIELLEEVDDLTVKRRVKDLKRDLMHLRRGY